MSTDLPDSTPLAETQDDTTPVQGTSLSLPEMELEMIQFWNDRQIFQKSLDQRRDAERFVFYEGPPTANGLPHPGHCLTRAIKDLYPRYKTMKGFLCERKAGWDTHGLPVEVEVCKELGIHSKDEIEKYGVEPFIHLCQQSVFRYMKQWEEVTERLGFWINLEDAYVTYHRSYVESVWWALKSLFNRGLLYQGHKIVWWWAQGGTALSAGEVGQGYKEVADPSVFVRLPLVDPLPGGKWSVFNEDLCISVNTEHGFTGVVDLLVWTTTPWTLPSNQFAAVHPDLDYAVVRFEKDNKTYDGRLTVIAASLVETIAQKTKMTAEILETVNGSDLVGMRYSPPLPFYYDHFGAKRGTLQESGKKIPMAWRVVPATFVTTDSGTGIVHIAPAFGEDDFNVLQSEQARFVDGEGPELICCVAPDGKFTDVAIPYEGKWVKDADKEITRDIKAKELLFHQEQYLHDYPFCWRADEDPLIQYPRKSWFIKTTEYKDAMIVNNQAINWAPEHIKSGRFGNFLESNVDWALSRERYWGTPLPIWVCEKTGQAEAVGSYFELIDKPGVTGMDVWSQAKDTNPDLEDDLKVHKPYIDAIVYDSPFAEGAKMRRVPEVIDCWFDSGAMPFAQYGFPHKIMSISNFRTHFPADFISEAIDQTRGWFYSLLVTSTMLFDGHTGIYSGTFGEYGDPIPFKFPHPFKNCIVLGLMLGEDGLKMSKQKKNYREPQEIFDKYGADALRWYFFANQTPWTTIRYSETAIKESMPEFILRLQNVLSFYEVYSKIDGFDPMKWVNPDELVKDDGQFRSPCLRSAAQAEQPYRSHKSRTELDRWILSELNRTVKIVTESMDAYDHYNACGAINAFVDSLSNWYVRRSRDRFWSSTVDATKFQILTKFDAYWTLFECLVVTTKLIAPFVPFLAESIWQRLVKTAADSSLPSKESVHLCDFPVADADLIDEKLLHEMNVIREIVSVGRAARNNVKLKVRQPLSGIKVLFANDALTNAFWDFNVIDDVKIIQDELNVKNVEVLAERAKADEYVTFSVVPDFKKLGPKLGKQLPEVKKMLSEADGAALLAEMEKTKKITLQLSDGTVELTGEEIQIRLQAKEGFAAAQGPLCVVVLATELTDELLAEGRAREVVRLIQDRRKEAKCEYTDRILVSIQTPSQVLGEAIQQHFEYIKNETLAADLKRSPFPNIEPQTFKVDGEEITISIRVTS